MLDDNINLNVSRHPGTIKRQALVLKLTHDAIDTLYVDICILYYHTYVI